MPHLSPMFWMLSPLMFLLLLTPMVLSFLWWSQSPQFPIISSDINLSKSNPWNWQ